MAKDKISDYSTTANSNTDIGGINVDEGCAPSGINDAIRTLMAQLKTWQSGGQDVYIHPAGSASAPSITANGDTNTGIFFPAADTVGIATGGTERARVDSSGNLGLGVTPSAWSTSWRALEIGSGTSLWRVSGQDFRLSTNLYNDASNNLYKANGYAAYYSQGDGTHNWYYAASGTAGSAITFTKAMTLDASGNLGVGTTSPAGKLHTSGGNVLIGLNAASTDILYINGGGMVSSNGSSSALKFGIDGTERARIDSSGNLLVGATDTNDSSTGFKYNNTRDGAGHPRLVLSDSGSTNTYVPLGVYSTGASAYRFYVGAGGTVYATNTTITAISSDARLKQDIVDYDKGLSEVLSLRPRYFAYKTEPDIKLAGFISQEVQTVMPEAIEPTLEDPEMMTYSIDWHPLLVKAIQEQQAIIETLTARIEALEQA